MTKTLTITATMPVPEDVFEQADALSAIKPHFAALHDALHEATGGKAVVTHSIGSPRAKKATADGAPKRKPGRPAAVQAVA